MSKYDENSSFEDALSKNRKNVSGFIWFRGDATEYIEELEKEFKGFKGDIVKGDLITFNSPVEYIEKIREKDYVKGIEFSRKGRLH